MKRAQTGQWINHSIGRESYRAFVPDPLPPNPPLRINNKLQELLDQSLLELGRLDSVSTMLPDTSLFIYMYIRKEAVLSSQIENTQTSLSDLLLFENKETPGVPLDDVQEVSNYVRAMNHGLKRLRQDFPLSLRLIKEIHKILLSKGRGSEKEPGEFKKGQNWLGGTRPGNAVYVPTPPEMTLDCMGKLEKFLHNIPYRTPVLIKAALSHVQFETIHPFPDGNGRLGRLLITFLLCAENTLKEPLLYLSLYFKKHRQTYYDLLQKVRIDGNWESWLVFFLDGVIETAQLAVKTTQKLGRMFEEDRVNIQTLGRSAGSVIRVHQVFQKHPIRTVPNISKLTKLSAPTVMSAINKLEELGLVREISGRKWSRLYTYDKYLQVLNEGTEPIK